ncbi:hypothetical protein HIM_01198 [Hirsutella minnesotensis 3608]|nr:hypothetical protein HIM_01198 [Hirsutella minnesotensis 3608]
MTSTQKAHKGRQLHLVVIGAGLAGLAAAVSMRLEGHQVTVLEKSSELQEVGAGLQVTPNATRLLHHWGVFEELSLKAAVPSYLAVRRYDGTRLLAYDDHFQDDIHERYGSPFWDLHRADVQSALATRAKDLGVNIRLGDEVVDVDLGNLTVTTIDGGVIRGDVIIGADGLWSRSRNLVSENQAQPQPTGDLAYRIIIEANDVQDPELKRMITSPSVNFWIGPNSHAVGYSVRRGNTYNLVLLTRDDLPDHVVRQAGDIDEMRALFAAWDPILCKLLSYVERVDKWRLMHSEWRYTFPNH